MRTIMDLKAFKREALNLPVADRAELAHELLESLDSLSPQEVDSLWLDEAERRAKEVDSGLVELIPAEEVFRSIAGIACWREEHRHNSPRARL